MRKRAGARARRRNMRPVLATGVLALGLVCAAAFTGITMQANALERVIAVRQAEIASAEAQNREYQAAIAEKSTTDYLIKKAQDYDFIRKGEGLIAVERSAQTSNAPAADGGRASRIVRWVQLFFGSR